MGGGPPPAVQRGEAPPMTPILITPTKTKPKPQAGGAPAPRQAAKSPPLRPSPTTPSKISPSSSPAAAKSSHSRKRPSKRPPASADFAPARRFAIPNTAREPSTSAKEKAQTPKLLNNFPPSPLYSW